MSLIGPRPEAPQEFVRQFTTEVLVVYINCHQKSRSVDQRLGAGQRAARTDLRDRRPDPEWDNYYIQNWSLRLDPKIAALTPLVEVLEEFPRPAPELSLTQPRPAGRDRSSG